MATANEFVTKLYEDEGLRKSLSEKVGVSSIDQINPNDEATGEQIVEAAKEWGYSFSLTDMQSAYKSLLEQHMSAGELSEEELDTVAGGVGNISCDVSLCSS